MAGSLPDVPGHRFAYHRDCVGWIDGNTHGDGLTPAPWTEIPLADLNDEDLTAKLFVGNVTPTTFRTIAIAFPEIRSVAALTARCLRNAYLTLWYSLDTVDGTDGTWTKVGGTNAYTTDLERTTSLRTNLWNVNIASAKGLRIQIGAPSSGNLDVYYLHIYGSVPVTANTDRLEFWSPGDDAILPAAALDFGDVLQGFTYDRTFRIKNLSTTKTATSTTVAADVVAGEVANPMQPDLQFSDDGGTTWASTITVPTLAPGAISPVLRVRRTAAANLPAATRFARISAVPAAYAA